MDEQKYSIIGKVEIGTDEYRDLIEGKIRAEKDVDESRSRAWKAERERDEALTKVKAQEKAIAFYREFVNMNEERISAYKVFLAGKAVEGDE